MSSIVVNSSHIISDNNSTFYVPFNSNTDLKNRKIALSSASLYFSWRNITNKNNKMSYVWVDDVTYNITLPEGFYEVSDIYAYIQYIFRKNKHYLIDNNGDNVYYMELIPNSVLYSIDIITYAVPMVLPDGYLLPDGAVWSLPADYKNPVLKIPSGINEILGYEVDFQTDNNLSINTMLQYNSTTAPNVNPNSSVLVVCDEVNNEFSNRGVLSTIIPSVSIGSLIDSKPPQLLFSKIKNGNYSGLTFRLFDMNFYPMEILDKEIVLNFIVE